MLRRTAFAAGCGLVSALFQLSILTGSPGSFILAYLAQFPLFVAGLSLGTAGAAVAGAAAAAAMASAPWPWSTAIFLVANALPVLLLTHKAMQRRMLDSAEAQPERSRVEWYPAGSLVVWLVGLGVVAVVAAGVAWSGSPGGLHSSVREMLSTEIGRLLVRGEAAAVPAAQLDGVISLLAAVFPALAASSWLIMAAANGVLAQGVLARFGRNARPSPDLAALALPGWAPVPVAIAGLLATFGSDDGTLAYVGLNVLLVLGVAFFFAGLAVVHAAVRRYPARGPLLAAFYVLMVIFGGWPIVLVIGLGFVDQWAGLRQRFAAALPGRGEE
jgi:hypothetical protein